MSAVDVLALTFENACAEIAAGRAKPHSLWVLLSKETDRDGYGLRPEVWEGPGEYQRLTHEDGRDVFVKLHGFKSLPHPPVGGAK